MTDLPTADDRFERELRAALLDSVSPQAPRSLGLAAASIVARPARPWPSPSRLMTGLVAAALGLGILAFGVMPVLPSLRTAVAPAVTPSPTPRSSPEPRAASASPSGSIEPATSTAPTSPAPSRSPVAAYAWQADDVRLTAADVELTFGTAQSHADVPGPGGSGSLVHDDPSSWPAIIFLTAAGHHWGLYLDFRSDATDWWLDGATMHMINHRHEEITLHGTFPRAPIGAAFQGDIALEGSAAEGPVRLVLSDVTLDPEGLGTGPHAWNGCVPLASLDRGANKAIRAVRSPQRFATLAASMDLCVVYLWVRPTDGGHLTEVWCTPPDGTVFSVGVGDQGEAVVTVIQSRKGAPRAQPVEGWGCQPSATASPSGMSGGPSS